jgi:hypothetical protein
VEARAVQRALDLLALDEALRQQRVGVRADVLHRVVALAQQVHADVAPVDHRGQRRLLGHLVDRADVSPLHDF